MAYIALLDLQNFLGAATVTTLFDDTGTGTVNTAAVTQVCQLASTWLDGKLARNYSGPFPITQNPLPQNVVLGALLKAKAIAYERHPEYVKRHGDGPTKEADDFADQLCEAKELLSDFLRQPTPSNVGTVVSNAGPRLIIDGVDGSFSGGDF